MNDDYQLQTTIVSAVDSEDFVFPLLDDVLKKNLSLIADTIRGLAMDAVQRAGSGHAGTPMGCAELGAYLYGIFFKHNPHHPSWMNRDRFILSAGHASMLPYSCLHLAGYALTLEDIKCFRQLNSKTPSHPQHGLTHGVETTTGLDGQGIAHAVGQALGLKLLESKFNRANFLIYDAKVVVLAGDGCFMEGVSHEACALAAHLHLNNLIVIYDRNKTSLDGFVSESCSEDTKKRYEAYGWDVYEINGHDFEAIHHVFSQIRQRQNKPVLVIADTIIGKGAPTLAGSHFVHNDPLAEEERSQAKRDLGLPDQEFYVSKEVYCFFTNKLQIDYARENQWNEQFFKWAETFPALYIEFQKMANKWLPQKLEKQLQQLSITSPISGRRASHVVLNWLGDLLPGLYGGSADLARSDMTYMHSYACIASGQFFGRNIKYGVREFGMAAMAIGLAQTDMLRPFIGTFLAFSDYMLSAVRMAAFMQLPVIYQLTHDSIFIGQDGPTHQPVEQLAHLRAIPNLQVIRPADANEVKMAWLAALKYAGPTAIVLSRQELPLCSGTARSYAEGVGRGAYIIRDSKKPLTFTLIATGSEVALAIKVARELESRNYAVRVISMPCWQLFDKQPITYQESIFSKESGMRISIEAASNMGWHKYVLTGKTISLDTFGKSALPKDLAQEFGFTVEQIVEKILQF
jgi:transketolase